VKCNDEGLITLAFDFKEQSTYETPSVGWLKFVEEKCNEMCGNYLAREHEDMQSAFGGRRKLLLNRIMDALGFEYPDYEESPANTRASEKKRAVKKEAEELSLGQIKKKARIIQKDATAKKALAPIKIAVTQKQGKGSMTTTSLRNCIQILEIMNRPL
jgi:hypothetical protein